MYVLSGRTRMANHELGVMVGPGAFFDQAWLCPVLMSEHKFKS